MNLFACRIWKKESVSNSLKKMSFSILPEDWKVNDPAMDLGVISAVLSSNMDMAIERDIAMTGEVGLSGEIRPVTRVEQRILEAEKLGFKRILVPIHN